jgi:galactose mutarotase-like enzyme
VSIDQSPWCSLSSGDLSAQVDPLGAQLSVLRDRSGRDLLWDGDKSIWAGRAPILFPIVGALAEGTYRLASAAYRLPRHGFARVGLFQVIDSSPRSALFRLRADDESFKVYPFQFELDVRVALVGPTFSMTTVIRNQGDADMPASVGYHPALRWPLPFGQARSSHFIEFEHAEPSPIRRLDSDGLLRPERFPTPVVQRQLKLTDALFRDDAVIFDDLSSRSVIYGANDGPRIRVGFPDAVYLGIWTKPQAHFICIEPWRGVADPQGYAGDFCKKPGMSVLPAGAETAITMSITLLP